MRLRDRVAAFMGQARSDLAGLVAIRSVADPLRFPRTECVRAAEWVVDRFASVGFIDIGLHETGDGSLVVYGERRVADPAAPTVLLYAHYDVHPPLDERAWRTPPFRLTEVDGRWYGRGTAACKGTIVMHLTALRALAGRMPVTLKVLVGGSQEQGTGGLADFVARHPSLLRADAVLVCDTGNAALGMPATTLPHAEILLMGVGKPRAPIHAPNESIHPREIEMSAMAEALFLCRYGGC